MLNIVELINLIMNKIVVNVELTGTGNCTFAKKMLENIKQQGHE